MVIAELQPTALKNPAAPAAPEIPHPNGNVSETDEVLPTSAEIFSALIRKRNNLISPELIHTEYAADLRILSESSVETLSQSLQEARDQLAAFDSDPANHTTDDMRNNHHTRERLKRELAIAERAVLQNQKLFEIFNPPTKST